MTEQLHQFRSEHLGNERRVWIRPPVDGQTARRLVVFLDAELYREKVGEGVTLYFICADALEIYRAAMARGLEATRPAVGNGMRVTELKDPDGYRIAFESLTDAAEDAVFAG